MEGAAPSKWSKLREGLIWLGLIGFFGVVHASTDRLAGNDSYYHIKYAYLLWHEGALWDFRWLQGTSFRDVWVDTEMLYHVLLIPFTLFGDLYIGAKVASAFFGGTALFAAYRLIVGFDAEGSGWRRHGWLFALVLTASSKTMLYRLSMTRAPAASVIFMMGALWLVHRRAWRPLLVLGFFYAWMYHVSVLLVPFALFFAIGHRIESGRWDLRPSLAIGAGILAGMVVNPYFPHSFTTFVDHVLEIGIGGSALPKGGEWAPYDTWYMATTTSVAWAAGLAGAIALGGTRRTISGRTFGLLLCAAMMATVFFKSRRFVEYFPVFMVVFSASAIHDLVEDPRSWWPELRAWLGKKIYVLQAVLTVGLVGWSAQNNWLTSREAAQNAWPWRFAGAARWLEENTPEGSQVYNAQWDVFPELVFHNHHNSWTLGLDPNFTYFLEPRLYWLSNRLSNGQVPQSGLYVKTAFNSDYVVASKNNGLARTARYDHAGLEQVFEDDHAVVLKATPPDNIYTVEGELWEVEVQPGAAQCWHREPGGGMGNASARGYLRCQSPEPQLVLRYPIQLPVAGKWKVEARFLTGPTPAKASVTVGGQAAGTVSVEASSTRIGRQHQLGVLELSDEPSYVEVVFEGPARDHLLVYGLDYVRFRASR